MDSVDLTMFEAVARAGGMTQAAKELNTVQSNVTARLQRLERELGVKLFRRHSRGVTLTDAGRDLLPFAASTTALLAEAKRALVDQSAARGTLVIGSLESTAATRLPPILASYAAACPNVDVAVHTGTSEELVERVLLGKLDGAFVVGPVTNPDLLGVPVVDEELVVLTAPSVSDVRTWLRQQSSVKSLVFRLGCAYRRRFEALLAEQGTVGVRWLEFGTLEGIIGCVSAGLGVSLLPYAAVERAHREHRVAVHRVPREYAVARIAFVRRRATLASLGLLRFAECCASQPWPKPRGIVSNKGRANRGKRTRGRLRSQSLRAIG